MLYRSFLKESKLWTQRRLSAPSRMIAFLFLCMIIIFGIEWCDLANREKNLQFRQSFATGICKYFFFNFSREQCL